MRLKYVLRRLVHSPGFTLVTALTLALGIGANSAIFSVVEGILLKPLPYPHAERLVAMNHTAPGINFKEAGGAPFLYFTYRDQGRVFERAGLWTTNGFTVTGLAEPERILAAAVTADVLPVLGISPSIGRWFSDKEDLPGAPETAATHLLDSARDQRRTEIGVNGPLGDGLGSDTLKPHSPTALRPT